MNTNPTREQWMLAQALAGVIHACNAPFCYDEIGEPEEINRDPRYIDNVATRLAELCSRMAIEDTMELLEKALEKFPVRPTSGMAATPAQ
jgi:hypothetical protein